MNWFHAMFKEAAPAPMPQTMTPVEEKREWETYQKQQEQKTTEDGIQSAVIYSGEEMGYDTYPVMTVYYSDGTKNDTKYFGDTSFLDKKSKTTEDDAHSKIDAEYKQWADQNGLEYVPLTPYDDSFRSWDFHQSPVTGEKKIFKAEKGWEKWDRYAPDQLVVKYVKNGLPGTKTFGEENMMKDYNAWAAKMRFIPIPPQKDYEAWEEESAQEQALYEEQKKRRQEEMRQRNEGLRARELDSAQEALEYRLRKERPPRMKAQPPGVSR